MYSSFASYHAYLEFPVVLALLLGTRPIQPVEPIQPVRQNIDERHYHG